MDVIGYTASALTIFAFTPQAVKVIRTRSTKDLALLTYLVLFTSSALWVTYAFMIKSYEICIANTVICMLTAIICAMKITEKKPRRRSR